MIIQSFATAISAMLLVLVGGMALTGIAVSFVGDLAGAAILLCWAGLLGACCVGVRRTCCSSPSVNLAVNSAAVATAWFIASICAAVPIWLIAVFTPRFGVELNPTLTAHRFFLNSWYDGTSAITSAGLTSTLRSTELTPAIQLWRSVGQWIGGIGMAVIAVKLIDNDQQSWTLYRGETRQQDSVDLNVILRRIVGCYLGLTFACGLSFCLFGMKTWQALNHCLIIVSTGGLTVVNDSFGSYSIVIQFIACVFMLLGACSFSAIHLSVTGMWRQLLKRSDVRGFAVLVAMATAVMIALSRPVGEMSLWDQLFNLVSAVTTCGVSSGSIIELPHVVLLGFVMVMLIGGCSDSTAGGMKLNRTLWLLKVLRTEVSRVLDTNRRLTLPTWNRRAMDQSSFDSSTHHCVVIVILFCLCYLLGIFGLRIAYAENVSLMQILFQTASALSTVGLSMGLIGPDRPAAAKCIEIVLMIAGRLEVMALLLTPFVLSGHVSENKPASEDADHVV